MTISFFSEKISKFSVFLSTNFRKQRWLGITVFSVPDLQKSLQHLTTFSSLETLYAPSEVPSSLRTTCLAKATSA